ncbi:hypothetical protein CR513_38877, partial [Mucuna pruriens]
MTQAQLIDKSQELKYGSVGIECNPSVSLRQPTSLVCMETTCTPYDRRLRGFVPVGQDDQVERPQVFKSMWCSMPYKGGNPSVIAMVIVGCAIAMYCLVTMILCNKKYSITTYQNALAKAASMEMSTWVSHQILAHKYEKKHDDVADGDAHGTRVECFCTLPTCHA